MLCGTKESIAERGRAIRTFVCIVPETQRQVTADNGESQESGSVLGDRSGSSSVRELNRPT